MPPDNVFGTFKKLFVIKDARALFHGISTHGNKDIEFGSFL